MNGVWKLTAMAGVIGIGLLVVLQAQRGMSQPGLVPGGSNQPLNITWGDPQSHDEDADPPAAATTEPTTPTATTATTSNPVAQTETPKPAPRSAPANPFADFETPPQTTRVPTPAASPTTRGLDFRDQPSAPPQQPTPSPANQVPAEDPFGGSNAAVPSDAGTPTVADDPFGRQVPLKQTEPAETEAAPEITTAAGAQSEADTVPLKMTVTEEPSEPAEEAVSPFQQEPSSEPPMLAPSAQAEPTTVSDDPFGSAAEPSVTVESTTEPQVKVATEPLFPAETQTPATEPDAGASPSSTKSPGLRERPALPRLNLATPESAPVSQSQPEATTAAPPRRLQPPPDAAKIATTEIRGDGTVSEDAPRGTQKPELKIEKIAPANAVLGQPLIYSIVVKNIGGSPARQVVVEDRVPKGTKLTGTAPQAEMIEKRLIWRIGTLNPGEERKISIRVVPFEEGQIGSIATVNFVAEVAAETVITAPQLVVEITGPKRAKVGEPVEFTFKVTNSGNGEASNVVIRNLIPPELQHPAGNDLEYAAGTLPPGGSREVKLTVAAAKPGAAVNQAIVTADGGLSTEAKAAIEIVGELLALSHSGPSKAYVGRAITFTNTVANRSGGPSAKVVVRETVPAGLDFADASDGGRFDPKARTIIWQFGPLDAGATKSLTAKLLPKAAGPQHSTVTLAGAGGSHSTVESDTMIEGFASLVLEPLQDKQPVAVGEQVQARLRVQNRGSAAAKNLTLAIQVPEQLRIVTAQSTVGAQQNGQTLRFEPVTELAPKAEQIYDVTLEAVAPGDSRLELQLSADHLSRPVRREEALTIFADAQ